MKKTIQVPSSLEDVTIGQYKHLESLSSFDEDTRLKKQIAFLCSIPEASIDGMTRKSMTEILEAMEGLLTPEANWPLVQKVELDGIQYGFHPKLDDLTIGEFADIETYAQDAFDNLESIMAILYRPIAEEKNIFYTIEDYEGGGGEKFLNLPMSVALGAWAFFLTIGAALQISTHNSLAGEVVAS